MTARWTWIATTIAVAVVMFFGGCASRRHIREDFGEHTRLHFAKQRVHRHAARGKPEGLDSEEAALIHGQYRQTLGASDAVSRERQPESQVLIVEPTKGGGYESAFSRSR